MALLLQQVTDKGVGATYHRISNISIDFTTLKAKVTVASYATDEYRENEQDFNTQLGELNALRAELDELIQDANDDNVERRQELSELINDHPLSENGSDAVKDLRVFEKVYDIDLPAKYDRTTIYGVLKTLPEFENATDV